MFAPPQVTNRSPAADDHAGFAGALAGGATLRVLKREFQRADGQLPVLHGVPVALLDRFVERLRITAARRFERANVVEVVGNQHAGTPNDVAGREVTDPVRPD